MGGLATPPGRSPFKLDLRTILRRWRHEDLYIVAPAVISISTLGCIELGSTHTDERRPRRLNFCGTPPSLGSSLSMCYR